ncbi:FHA domain-containing protein [Georgenia alba]|uniref:FHA domain-containing protein n=1 Tax=Georgenia alba TaxID=2233858 RepID=A0ABW2Q3C6_9MICO
MRAFQPVSTSPLQSDGVRTPVSPTRLLDGVVRADRRLLSLLLDVGTVLVAAAVAGGLAGSAGGSGRAPVVVAGAAAVVVTVLLVLDRHRTGQSAGHRLLRLRTVDRRTALPHVLARGAALTVDLRKGRDPLHLQPAPATAVSDRNQWGRGKNVQLVSRLVLVADDGFTHRLESATIIGRNPTNPPGMDHRLVGVTDLSRTMSKSHALLEPSVDSLIVVDLSSTNGTAVARPGGRFERIPPRARVNVPVGSRIAFGDKVMEITDSAPASPGTQASRALA